MRPLDLLVVGDANPDVVLSGVPRDLLYGQREQLVSGATLVLGGSGAITACGAARLGLRTAFVGRVGDDAFGRFTLDALAERGVNVDGCVIDRDAGTAVTVVLNGRPDRAILTAPGCLTRFGVQDIDPVLAMSARHVHVSSYFLQPGLAADLPQWFAAIRASGGSTSLDTNDDPSGRWDRGVWDVIAHTDVLLPNEAEVLALTSWRDGDVLAAGRDLSAGVTVIKRGRLGAAAWSNGELLTEPGLAVAPVDTVGAGDSFNAGFLAGWLGGHGLRASLRLGVACGSLSTRAAGGTAAQPTMDEATAALAVSA
jgi:sugar/nucleoside kinase (ribokinase family)